MKTYVGIKIVKAQRMTKDEFEKLKGAAGLEQRVTGIHLDGYLVEYLDGGRPNIPGFEGYVSWSPQDVFEAAYVICGDVSHLATHQQRVVAERAVVSNWLAKLLAFFQGPLFPTVEEAERARMRSQARFMDGYAAVLEERIAAFAAVSSQPAHHPV